jgi:hypothetical protein
MDLNDLPTAELARRAGWELRGYPLNTKDAALLRGLRPNTLEIERSAGKGPPYLQEGKNGRVTYSERDVLLWVLANRRRHTGQPHNNPAAAIAA